jgi:ABC-type multidrug transport system ATPase subunit
MNALEMRDVRRSFERGPEVLRGIRLEVAPGDVVALLGRNGAGKTTLLRVAMGMLHPASGSVRVLGLDPWRDPVALKRRIGYVSEEQILPGDLSVASVLDLHRRLFPSWDAALETRLCARFSLPPSARISTLSKGQARQVALVCAVAHRPELLLLDEPAGGLDPAARREVLETAIALLSEAGSTVVFSSHHMADVERIAGRVILIDDGRVLLEGELDALREGYCLALLPVNGAEAGALRSVSGCVRVRRKGQAWHAVFSLPRDEAARAIEARLGTREVSCRPISLEDLFVEMVEEARS